jgi:hypothetical protein
MNQSTSLEIDEMPPVLTQRTINFSWKQSPSTQRLLDVISSIIAAEYVSVAKQNPKLFLRQEVVK